MAVAPCFVPVAPSAATTAMGRGAPPQPLLDVVGFSDWRRLGGAARFEVLPPADGGSGPTVVGRGPIERNGFLASPRAFADFRLSVDVRLGSADDPRGERMNSGIQVRSEERDGTVAGLQVEVDPTPRRWSGGVYDERGRGWLAPLEGRPDAQAAFRPGEWNRYEVECRGPRIRTWLNGVACAEWFDAAVSGLLAFQVHGGPPCEVAFRAPMIEEFGAHAWRSVAVVEDAVVAADPRRIDGETGRGADGASGRADRPVARIALGASSAGVRLEFVGAAHARVVGKDGATLAEVRLDGETSEALGHAAPGQAGSGSETPTRTAPGAASDAEAKAPRFARFELVWLEGRGAVLRDGRRIGELAFLATPAAVEIGAEATRLRSVARLDPVEPQATRPAKD